MGGGLEGVVRKLGKGSGWLQSYTLVYRDTSSTAHVSDPMEHLEMPDAGEDSPLIKVTPDEENLPRVPNVARMLLLSSAQRINKRLGLSFGEQLDRVDRPSPKIK